MMNRENHSIVVLIPAYQPDKQLITIVDALVEKNYSVVVVNDGSSVQTRTIFENLSSNAKLLEHEKNKGKGAALKTGFSYILENYLDCHGVITADADGQHAIQDIDRVAQSMLEKNNILVLGSREFKGNVPLRSAIGNALARFTFATASGKWLGDTQTGLRGIPATWLPELLKIEGDRYEYEINMLLWAAKEKRGISEIKIETIYIENNQSSHFHPIRDAICVYSRILKFAASSLGAFCVDYVLVLLLRAITWQLDAKVSLFLSVVIARIISSAFNYVVNQKIVFHNQEDKVKTAAKYYITVVCLLLANYLLLSLVNLWIGVPLWIAKIIVELLLWIASYNLQKYFVFRK